MRICRTVFEKVAWTPSCQRYGRSDTVERAHELELILCIAIIQSGEMVAESLLGEKRAEGSLRRVGQVRCQ